MIDHFILNLTFVSKVPFFKDLKLRIVDDKEFIAISQYIHF